MTTITLHKVRRVVERPETEDIVVNTLSWFPNNKIVARHFELPSFQLTPYYLKDENGHLFENVYQFAKVYPQVAQQNQIIKDKLIWRYPRETHLIDGELQPAYWRWRDRGLNNRYAVRYPNGYSGKANCFGSLWKVNGEWQALDYLEARKVIYVQEYARLVQQTRAYARLQELVEAECALSFTDIDVPGTIQVSQENYTRYLNDASKSFGHTWVLAGLLLGLKLT
jgi:hypothetical protein